MKALIRNCVHGSRIFLSEIRDSSGRVHAIEKSSSHPEGIRNLASEQAGFAWYEKTSGYPNFPSVKFRETPHYAKLTLPFINGKKHRYTDGLWKNREAIESAIAHYAKVWKMGKVQAELAPLHGDLSLDNILYRGSDPWFIDWEHFSKAAAPIGFDALYLLLESLWFEQKKSRSISSDCFAFVRKQIGWLSDQDVLAPNFRVQPSVSVRKFILENQALWGEQIENFPTKFPILSWPEGVCASLDREISK